MGWEHPVGSGQTGFTAAVASCPAAARPPAACARPTGARACEPTLNSTGRTPGSSTVRVLYEATAGGSGVRGACASSLGVLFLSRVKWNLFWVRVAPQNTQLWVCDGATLRSSKAEARTAAQTR